MKVQRYRVKKTYEQPHGGLVASGPRYPGVLSDDGPALFTHAGAPQWTEVVLVDHLEEAPRTRFLPLRPRRR